MRLFKKQLLVGLLKVEIASSVKILWDKNKTSKLQHFVWQVNSEGLSTGSWCKVVGFDNGCVCCERGIQKSNENSSRIASTHAKSSNALQGCGEN